MVDTPPLMTADELLVHDARGMRTELVRGRLIVREPAGFRHGDFAARILVRIAVWLEADQASRGAPHPLGRVLAAETGFTLARSPDTVRAPDVAFVRWDRQPSDTRGFAELAPDLVVEVLSPGDRPGEIQAKVADWLDAGTTLVWVVDPARALAIAYNGDGGIALYDRTGTLVGANVLPGFTLPLSALFT